MADTLLKGVATGEVDVVSALHDLNYTVSRQRDPSLRRDLNREVIRRLTACGIIAAETGAGQVATPPPAPAPAPPPPTPPAAPAPRPPAIGRYPGVPAWLAEPQAIEHYARSVIDHAAARLPDARRDSLKVGVLAVLVVFDDNAGAGDVRMSVIVFIPKNTKIDTAVVDQIRHSTIALCPNDYSTQVWVVWGAPAEGAAPFAVSPYDYLNSGVNC